MLLEKKRLEEEQQQNMGQANNKDNNDADIDFVSSSGAGGFVGYPIDGDSNRGHTAEARGVLDQPELYSDLISQPQQPSKEEEEEVDLYADFDKPLLLNNEENGIPEDDEKKAHGEDEHEEQQAAEERIKQLQREIEDRKRAKEMKEDRDDKDETPLEEVPAKKKKKKSCLLYTSPSPRDS